LGGPQGDRAAAMRCFTQTLGEEDPGRKDMLLDIATEALSHLEVIDNIVYMLAGGAEGKLAEGAQEQEQLYRNINGPTQACARRSAS
jgi:Mn-containing catalase